MTLADERVLATLRAWLASVEQHIRYLELDDEAYRQRRDWMPHKRPTARELDVAKRRIMQLIRQIERRIEAVDETFSDSLELMSVVTSMVAREDDERFIPLIEPEPPAAETPLPTALPRAAQRPAAAAEPAAQATAPRRSGTRTRSRSAERAPGRTAATAPVRPPEPPASARPAQRPAEPPAVSAGGAPEALPQRDDTRVVVADAVRLLTWGRKWFELGDLIPQMHGRPPKARVRSILTRHREEIETLARTPED